MSKKHESFDAAKLNERKNNFSGFKFCPFCSSRLTPGTFDNTIRMACSDDNCDYIHYQNPVPAAGAIILENKKILLVKRAHPPGIGDWCIPAGYMEWNEHPTETTIRELAEETGLEVRILSFFEVYSGTDDPRSNAVLMLYLAERVGGELKAMDDALEVKYFGFDELPENIAFQAHRQALDDIADRILK